jgi:hypothetical protein
MLQAAQDAVFLVKYKSKNALFKDAVNIAK